MIEVRSINDLPVDARVPPVEGQVNDGRMDSLSGCMDECMERCTDGCMDGQKDGIRVGGWMNG